MRSLADLQGHVRQAMLTGETGVLESLLVGGRDGQKRLAVHQRHYAASLTKALLERFPATVWLVGSALVTDAARRYVRDYPPARPCIAEYGDRFPAYLATQEGARELPYVGEFAELEWHMGRLALAVDEPCLEPRDLSGFDPEVLADARLVCQSGVHYLRVFWGLDTLMSLYLADRAPDQFSLDAGEVWLELRGARGDLRMTRLPPSDFGFRATLARGASLTHAATQGLASDARFDPGQALVAMVAEGLVVAVNTEAISGAR